MGVPAGFLPSGTTVEEVAAIVAREGGAEEVVALLAQGGEYAAS